jgi:hypothetical protein
MPTMMPTCLRKLQRPKSPDHQPDFWSRVQTGYFDRRGVGDYREAVSGVHLVHEGKIPICNYHPAARMEFRVVSVTADLPAVGCRKCRRLYAQYHPEETHS